MKGQAAPSILVVDDSDTQALRLEILFEREGWTTTRAASAEEAHELLGHRMPDLLVVDHYLPGWSGAELCRRLRAGVETRGIPILMLTSEASASTELLGLDSGADDHVSKSVPDEVLVLRVRALLRKARAHHAVLGRGGQLRQARLLAIDDSPTYRELLSAELTSDGHAVEVAGSGEEGLERVRDGDFDGVLVDLVMPGMDGVEVCRRLADMRQSMDSLLVVLMLTAHESKSEMTRGLEAGADDFVGKSSDMAVLKARIRALLRRKFFQEQNQRILDELRAKELEAIRASAAQEQAELRAALADELTAKNRQLEETNDKLEQTYVQLVHAEKMASLGQLVAGIAHEINNPLSFAMSNLFLVRERLSKKAATAGAGELDQYDQLVADAEEGLSRVRDLVAKLRTFSRLDEGEFVTVDIHESLESVLLFLRHKMDERIELVRTYRASGLLGCFGGQLNQVFMNVIANAIDAMPEGGRLEIATHQSDETLEIAVTDSGPGVPAELRERIFEPFFTTKPVGSGTGLGLAISYGIIEHHLGRISVGNSPEGGAVVTIAIPVDLEARLLRANVC